MTTVPTEAVLWPPFSREPLQTVENVPWFIDRDNYAAAFGDQWQRWDLTQFDSHTGLPISEGRMRRVLGPLWDNLEGRHVIELGCGAGRFTEILLAQGAFVTSIDLSSAVQTNSRLFRSQPRHRAAGASILDLPFEPEQFDLAFCLGVLQHTPNPRRSLGALWRQVKPGGWAVFDQYRHNASTWTRSAWIFRAVLLRLDREIAMKATDKLVDRLLPIHRRIARYRSLEIGLNRLSPITAHFAGYPGLSDEDQLAWAQLNTHDNLTDVYKHHTTTRKMRENLELLHPSESTIRKLPYTVEVRAKK